MKKALKILIILMLIGSICTAISFFVFDYNNARKLLSKYSNQVTTEKDNKAKNLKNKDKTSSNKNDSSDDFSDFVNKKANQFADDLTESILDGVSEGLNVDFDEESWMNDKFSSDKFFGKYSKLLKTEKLEEFNQLNIESPYLYAKIVKSDEYKVEFYSQNDKKDMLNNVDIRKDAKKYTINCSEKFNKHIPCIVIYTANPENLKLDIDVKDGFFVSKDSFKSADIKMNNGMLSLSGKESYNLDIEMDNGVIKMGFDNYDARLKVQGDSGMADILGKKRVFEDTEFEEKFKNERDNIKIKIDSGVLRIK